MFECNKLKTLFCLFIFLILNVKAQNVSLDWVNGFGGIQDDLSFDMETDQNGNVIAVGAFKGTVDFDPSSNIYNLSSYGNNDIFVAKYDEFGAFMWAKKMGGSGFDRAHDVEITNTGDILVAGYFRNTVDFDPSSGVVNKVSSGDFDSYVQKLDEDGNHLWVKVFHGSGYDRINTMDIDNSGHIILGGNYTGTTDFDPGTGQVLLSSGGFGSSTGYNSFVVKLDASGNLDWVRNFGSTSQNEICYGLAVDSNDNIYSSGFFKGTVDFNPGASIHNLSTTVSSRAEIYISKLDANGDFVWAKNFPASSGTIQGNLGWEIEIHPSGDVITMGYFSGTVDFDPGIGTQLLTSNGDKDGYISRLTSAGDYVSVYQIGGTSEDRVTDIDFDENGNQYVTGFFGAGSSVDFDNSSTSSYPLTALGSNDVFVLKIDSVNNFVWAHQFGSITSSPYLSDVGMSITRNNQSIYITGAYNNTTDFDPTIGVHNLISNGSSDGFIVKLNEGCVPTQSNLIESTCESTFISPSGQILSSTGTYIDTLVNMEGCDSIITIDLTINETLNTTIQMNSASLTITGNPVGTTYEWINCENMLVVQAGSVNETFSQPQSGNSYAVIINNQGCIDTSECVTFDKISVDEYFDDIISIYPNPISGENVYVFNKRDIELEVVLRNNLGVILNRKMVLPLENTILVPMENGIYYLEFILENKRYTKKLIRANSH